MLVTNTWVWRFGLSFYNGLELSVGAGGLGQLACIASHGEAA